MQEKSNPISQYVAKYSNPAGSEFPVISYNNVQLVVHHESGYKNATGQEIFDFMKTVTECGFNVYMWVNGNAANETLVKDSLRVAKTMQLPFILNISGRLPHKSTDKYGNVHYYGPESLINVLSLYSAYPNLWGYVLTDEPQYADWNEDAYKAAEEADNLILGYNTYKDHSNGKPCLINLKVDISKETTGYECSSKASADEQKRTYTDYLIDFYNQFKPALMSVDIYPIYINIKDNNRTIIKGEYFFALEAIGNVSRDKNVPFWLYLQCNHLVEYHKDGSLNKLNPSPSVGILRYQAMNAIAHGIQGVVFWSYGMPFIKWHTKVHDDDTEEKIYAYEGYINAPFTNHRKTQLWYNCKAVIPEVKLLGKVLLNAKFQGARHVVSPTTQELFIGIQEYTEPFGCIYEAYASGKGFVITLLKKGTTNYMAIVNHDWENYQNITIYIPIIYSWSEIVVLEETSPNITNTDTDNDSDIDNITKIKRTLKPGGMFLINYKSKMVSL